MKKIISTILVTICLMPICLPISCATADYTVTQYKSEESEKFIWNSLKKYTSNDRIAAGIMGMYYRESQFRSDAIVGWSVLDAALGGDSSQEFTKEVDVGLLDGSTREYFIEECHYHIGGYGLNQLYSIKTLENFYDFAQKWSTSISDAEMQCAFTVWDMENNFPELWELINSTTDLELIGKNIAVLYDGTTTGNGVIASYAKLYYDKYHKE